MSSITGVVTSAGTPVAGVAVSDGRDVARTGADGRFELAGWGPFVTVTTPTGYGCGEWFLPRGDELVFELEPERQTVPWGFVQITDLHLSLDDPAYGPDQGDAVIWLEDGQLRERGVATPDHVEALFHEIAQRFGDTAFVVCTGDVANHGTDAEHRAYAEIVSASGLRVRTIPGNHDHESVEQSTIGALKARTAGADIEPPPTTYEKHYGPRWYSFDHGGVHFAAIDWTTWHLRIDASIQEGWLREDLNTVEPGTPVILLTHDLMPAGFFERLPRQPMATFSGHWHTTRVADASGGRHYNTGPATYGGLDYCPPHYRVATWDGSELDVDVVVRAPEALRTATLKAAPPAPADGRLRWSAPMPGALHTAAPVVAGELVVAAWRDERKPGGGLVALDADGGERRWSIGLASAVKATPLVVGDRVVAVSVTGETVCVDLETGAARWRREIDDPLRLWVHLRPVTDGRLVFVGDAARFGALDLEDGSVVWMRDDLGVRGNITCHAHPAVIDHLVIGSFSAQVPDLWAVRGETGETVWPTSVTPASVYDLPDGEMAYHLVRTLVSGIGVDPGGSDVYVVRLGSRIERLRAATGDIVWSSEFRGWFNPSTPLALDDDVIAVEATGTVWCFRRSDGELRWRTRIADAAPLAMGPYRADGAVLLAPPTPVGDALVVPSGDGRIVALERGEGRVVADVDLGVPVVAALCTTDDVVIAAGVDGVLRALPLAVLAR